jgi:hypothetical protein
MKIKNWEFLKQLKGEDKMIFELKNIAESIDWEAIAESCMGIMRLGFGITFLFGVAIVLAYTITKLWRV